MRINKIKVKRKFLRMLVVLSILISPILIYIYRYPFYTGDFFATGSKPHTTLAFPKEKMLSIVVLPDCPFCHETIKLVELLSKRNPTLTIRYLVIGEETDSAFNRIQSRRVIVAENSEIEKIIYLTKGVFPTFVLSENNNVVKRWTNDEFGVVACDEIEDFSEN